MGRLGSRSGLELCQVMLTSQTSPTLNKQESSSGLILINDLLFDTVDSRLVRFYSNNNILYVRAINVHTTFIIPCAKKGVKTTEFPWKFLMFSPSSSKFLQCRYS